MTCKGCAERREKIKAQTVALIEWAKNPFGSPNPLTVKAPPIPPPIKSKKDISR